MIYTATGESTSEFLELLRAFSDAIISDTDLISKGAEPAQTAGQALKLREALATENSSGIADLVLPLPGGVSDIQIYLTGSYHKRISNAPEELDEAAAADLFKAMAADQITAIQYFTHRAKMTIELKEDALFLAALFEIAGRHYDDVAGKRCFEEAYEAMDGIAQLEDLPYETIVELACLEVTPASCDEAVRRKSELFQIGTTMNLILRNLQRLVPLAEEKGLKLKLSGADSIAYYAAAQLLEHWGVTRTDSGETVMESTEVEE